MGQLYTIEDPRTIYCRQAMSANAGVWNPVTRAWIFAKPADAANAMCELFRATRPSIAMRETLLEMIADGTAASAWGFDPAIEPVDVETLDREVAKRYLAAGYAVRRVFVGAHPLEDLPEDRASEARAVLDDALQHAAFDERARSSTSRTKRRSS